MNSSSRRSFLKQSAALSAAAAFTPYFAPQVAKAAAEQAPSDRFRVGCIGVGSMGRGDAHGFSQIADVVAVCDVDWLYGIADTLRSENIGRFDADGRRTVPDAYHDYRRVLDRDDIDIVSIVTPDHWHIKIAIEALQAGKHVFCQKPLTLTLEENQLIRAACKKYNRIFQVGTQQRSQHDQFMTASLMVRSGVIGRVKRVVCDIGGAPTSPPLEKREVPESLDWNFWLGQAPVVDFIGDSLEWGSKYKESRSHFEFRWWYEYSGGKFTDWGAHHIDCALWALDRLGDGTGPTTIDGAGAKHPVEFKDGYPTVSNQYNTSHIFDIGLTFADGLEMRVVSDSPDGNGILFEGEKGRFHVNRDRIKGKPVEEGAHQAFTEEDYVALYNGKPFEGHKQNFLRCIREGGLPISDVYSHVQAMNACHLCGIAARLGRVISWDPATETFPGDAQAASFIAREQRKGFEIPRN